MIQRRMAGIFRFMLVSCAVLLALLFVVATRSMEPEVVKQTDSQASVTDRRWYSVYVVSHGWHTGLIIPTQLIMQHIPQLKQRFKSADLIEFGWGDKGFYQANEITSGLTIKSLFWPTETVVHVVAVPANVRQYFPDSQIAELCLSPSQLLNLLTFIEHSLFKDPNGFLEKQKKGIYGDSQFYTGTGNYHFMNTCNKWTAKGLLSAGIDIAPTFKLTAQSVIDVAAQHSHALSLEKCHE